MRLAHLATCTALSLCTAGTKIDWDSIAKRLSSNIYTIQGRPFDLLENKMTAYPYKAGVTDPNFRNYTESVVVFSFTEGNTYANALAPLEECCGMCVCGCVCDLVRCGAPLLGAPVHALTKSRNK